MIMNRDSQFITKSHDQNAISTAKKQSKKSEKVFGVSGKPENKYNWHGYLWGIFRRILLSSKLNIPKNHFRKCTDLYKTRT